MNTFIVTVRTLKQRFQFKAIGYSSIDVHDAAIERFGVCGVTVKPV